MLWDQVFTRFQGWDWDFGISLYIEVREMCLDSCKMFAELDSMEIFAIATLPSKIYCIVVPWVRSGGDVKLCVIKLLN
jgi:hypothetical protein